MGIFEEWKQKREAREKAQQAENEKNKKAAELQVDAANFYELFKLKTSAMQAKIGTVESFVNENNQEVLVAYTEYGPITRTKLDISGEYQTTSKYMYEGVVPTSVAVKDKKVPSGYYAMTCTRGFMRDPDDHDHYPSSIYWHRYNGFKRDFGTGKAVFLENETDQHHFGEMDGVLAYFETAIANLEKTANKSATPKTNEENQPNA